MPGRKVTHDELFALRLPSALLKRIKKLADEERRDVSSMMRILLEDALDARSRHSK